MVFKGASVILIRIKYHTFLSYSLDNDFYTKWSVTINVFVVLMTFLFPKRFHVNYLILFSGYFCILQDMKQECLKFTSCIWRLSSVVSVFANQGIDKFRERRLFWHFVYDEKILQLVVLIAIWYGAPRIQVFARCIMSRWLATSEYFGSFWNFDLPYNILTLTLQDLKPLPWRNFQCYLPESSWWKIGSRAFYNIHV